LDLTLTDVEARILGCLLEKQATTPDVYPLTLNSLVSACNQKSNREPVMDLLEADVIDALESLNEKTLASLYQSGRSRTPKYQHRLHRRAFDEFNFSLPQLAILGVLFLRGPQTLGEIRSRCARIHEFPDLDGVLAALREMEERPDGPYVKMLSRQAGRKESRVAHLFCGDIDEAALPDASGGSSSHARLETLENQVEELSLSLHALEQKLAAFVAQFE